MSCPTVSRIVMAALCAATIVSSPRVWGQQETTSAAAEARDVLAAEADGLAEVKFVANDARSAQVVVTNRGDRPLTLRLPAAFAGVPLLALGVFPPSLAGVFKASFLLELDAQHLP